MCMFLKMKGLTVADDRSTVYTSTRPPLLTQRRSPAHVTVAVVVVIAQLVRESTAAYKMLPLKIAERKISERNRNVYICRTDVQV